MGFPMGGATLPPLVYSFDVGRPRRVTCRHCGRHLDECGPLSTTYQCEECSLGRFVANIDTMIATAGAGSAKWRRGMLDYARRLEQALGGEE